MPTSMQSALGEYLLGYTGRAGMQVALGEINNLPARSPEKFKVWDSDKGQWVHSPRYVWDGSAWQPVS